jgi:hypothetical protein
VGDYKAWVDVPAVDSLEQRAHVLLYVALSRTDGQGAVLLYDSAYRRIPKA